MKLTNLCYTRKTSSASIIEPMFTNWRKGTLPLNHRNQVVLRVRDINKKKSESHYRLKKEITVELWEHWMCLLPICHLLLGWKKRDLNLSAKKTPNPWKSIQCLWFCLLIAFLLHLLMDKKKIISTTNLSVWDWSDFFIFKEFKSNFGVIAMITTWLLKLLSTSSKTESKLKLLKTWGKKTLSPLFL